jgi:hypothetical protein
VDVTRLTRPIRAEALEALRCFVRPREGRREAEVNITVLYEGVPEFVLAVRSPQQLDFLVRSVRRCGREAWGK